jgi:hypothetical protein
VLIANWLCPGEKYTFIERTKEEEERKKKEEEDEIKYEEELREQ